MVGGYFEVQQFMSGLEGLSRALRVTALTLAPGANPVTEPQTSGTPVEDGRTITATITGPVFMAAGATAPVAVTPVAPAAAVGRAAAAAPAAAPAAGRRRPRRPGQVEHDMTETTFPFGSVEEATPSSSRSRRQGATGASSSWPAARARPGGGRGRVLPDERR